MENCWRVHVGSWPGRPDADGGLRSLTLTEKVGPRALDVRLMDDRATAPKRSLGRSCAPEGAHGRIGPEVWSCY